MVKTVGRLALFARTRNDAKAATPHTAVIHHARVITLHPAQTDTEEIRYDDFNDVTTGGNIAVPPSDDSNVPLRITIRVISGKLDRPKPCLSAERIA